MKKISEITEQDRPREKLTFMSSKYDFKLPNDWTLIAN